MKILGIDPGGTTGLCGIDTDEERVGYIRQEEFNHAELYQALGWIAPDLIVCERFTNDGNKAAKFISGELIGVVKLWGLHNEIRVHMQNRDAKEWWTREKLIAAGEWRPGEKFRHSMDALRHVLYYLQFERNDLRWVHRLQTG